MTFDPVRALQDRIVADVRAALTKRPDGTYERMAVAKALNEALAKRMNFSGADQHIASSYKYDVVARTLRVTLTPRSELGERVLLELRRAEESDA